MKQLQRFSKKQSEDLKNFLNQNIIQDIPAYNKDDENLESL